MPFAPSGRFKLLDAPYASPGKCGLCGYAASGENEPADKRQYVDFNLDFEYYGALYFCTECLHSLFTEMGYVTPAEADELRGRLQGAVEELGTFTKVVEVINGLANFLVDAGWITHTDPNLPSVDESGPDSISEGSDSDEGSDDSGSAETDNESGPDDLSDSTSLRL